MGVQRRPQDSVEPLETSLRKHIKAYFFRSTHFRLSGTCTVESSGHGIKDRYDGNSNKEPWEEDSSDNTG
jgi:hypothetical protein